VSEERDIETIFARTVACASEAERASYLTRACPDPKIRSEVEARLATHLDIDPLATLPIKSGPGEIQSSKASPRGDPYVGRTLDNKYRLERLLGSGGMGAVYLGTHLGTDRTVAVKLIRPEFMRTPELVERFKREARAAGRLRHPNIVDVTDFGIAKVDHEQIAYLVMEYLEGRALSEVMAREKQLALPWVVDILEQVCSAVQAAHQRGIVHRDLKPANIWLEPNTLGGDRVKVLDFGLAKLADELETSANMPTMGKSVTSPTAPSAVISATPPSEALTQVGAILGTPLYMSPEQCRGETADAHSDIYTLGVIAYQMLCGKTPFAGPSNSILRAHQDSEPPPLEEQGAKVPKQVSSLILRALRKDPRERPESAIAFAHLLRANTDTLGALYRRAFALYSEFFPKIFKLSLIAHIPVVLVTLLILVIAPQHSTPIKIGPFRIPFEVALGGLKGLATFVTGSIISGMVAVMVTQLAVTPLRPLKLSSAFLVLRQRWWPFFRTGLEATWWVVFGFALVIPGIFVLARLCFWAPIVLLEGLSKRPALKRSNQLALRSRSTAVLAAAFQLALPALVEKALRGLITLTTIGGKAFPTKVASELSALNSILVLPLVSIVVALVYLKLRQLGGQDLRELLSQIESREKVSGLE
jgi:serine/threonine protein kinase